MTRRTIKVGSLARIEGESGLTVVIRDGAVRAAELRIFEPPRFFEALLRGRAFTEAPDITARICGICPVAYQMSAVHAMERALGLQVDGPLRALRRLLYCGEWIESHVLHIVMLHAPDFLGYAGAVEMARDHGEAVRRGLALKKLGNEIVALVGGREIHPINVRVGGFHRVPRRAELLPLRARLDQALEEVLALLRWVSGFDIPDWQRDYTFVALHHPQEYPMNEGRIRSSHGLDIDAEAWEEAFEEVHLRRSTALHARLRADGGSYLVGPMARYALNHAQLAPMAREAAREAGLGPVCTNPFRSIAVRAVEVLHACAEAMTIIDAYAEPDAPAVPVIPAGGTGAAATEAPRGLLWHRYRLAADGLIEMARIVPPTSQNQAAIEQDLVAHIGGILDQSEAVIRQRCEQSVRNHDPCISCATHFLRLDLDRG
jgi:sulfhydrogenase subunit alpha